MSKLVHPLYFMDLQICKPGEMYLLISTVNLRSLLKLLGVDFEIGYMGSTALINQNIFALRQSVKPYC